MNRSLPWLGAALFAWGIGEGMFFLFQPIYLQQLGAPPLQIGVILGAFGAMTTLAHIPAGYLADRIGRRPMLIASWVTGVLATLLMAFALSLPIFVVGILFYGLTNFVVSPMDSYVTAARGKWSLARVFTFMSMAYNAGALLGPITGGWIGDHYGLHSIYFISAGIFFISTLLVLSIKAQPRDHHDPENPPQSLLKNSHYLGFLAVYFVVAFATYLAQPLSPNFLRNQHGLSLSAIGELGSVSALGITLFSYLLGKLEARSGFILGQIGSAAFALILWRASDFGLFTIGYLLLGGYRVLRNLGVAQVRPFVHESQMGVAYGIAETIGSSTFLLAPPLAGYLYTIAPALMYPVGLILMGFGLAVSLIFIPRSKKLPVDHIELEPDI